MMMFRVLFALGVMLPALVSAGILMDPEGNLHEGQFVYSEKYGLQFKDEDGKFATLQPDTFRALEIDTRDIVWPEAFRASAKVETGMLGQYFERTNLEGPKRERVDYDIDYDWYDGGPFAGWRVDHFSIRWTGSFEVPETGDYQFITTSDDGVRLKINGKQLINNWSEHSRAEDKTKLRLEAGKQHQIVVEYFENTGESVIKVEYIDPTNARRNLSELSLTAPDGIVGDLDLPRLVKTGLKPGILLRDGSFLNAKVTKANDTAFVLGKPFEDLTISTFNVARVVFREIPSHTAAAARPSRRGALLVGGDFVDGEFKSFDRGMLKMSSLLFGYQSLETKYETHALLLREPTADKPRWRVRDYHGNVLLGESIRFEGDRIVVSSEVLKELSLPIDTIYRIDHSAEDDLYPESIQLGPDSIHSQNAKKVSEDEQRRQSDSLKRLASREKSRIMRTVADTKNKMQEEVRRLEEARKKEQYYADRLAKVTGEHDKYKSEYESMAGHYTAAQKEYDKLLAESRTSQRDYDKRRGEESRASSAVKNGSKEVSRVQSLVNRYARSGDEKQLKRWKDELVKKQKIYATAKETYSKAQKATRAAADQKSKLQRAADTAKRAASRAKSDRDGKKRYADSKARTMQQEVRYLNAAKAKVTAALAAVENRKEDELR